MQSARFCSELFLFFIFLHKSAQIHPHSSTCLKLGKALIYMATYCFRLVALGCLLKSLTGGVNPWTPLNSYRLPLDLCTIWFTLAVKLTLFTTVFPNIPAIQKSMQHTNQIPKIKLNFCICVHAHTSCFYFLTPRRPCIVFPSELKQSLKGLGSGNFAGQSGELPRQSLQGRYELLLLCEPLLPVIWFVFIYDAWIIQHRQALSIT